MDPQLLDEGRRLADELTADPPPAVVLTGRVGYFSAGADLKVAPTLDADGQRAPLEARTPSRALIADGKVFAITADGTVYHVRALDARDGSELWRVRIPQESSTDPVDAAYDAGRVHGSGR